MNNTAKGILLFVAGATIGSLVTYKIVKKDEEERIHEQVEEIREAIHKANGVLTEEEAVDDAPNDFVPGSIHKANGVLTDAEVVDDAPNDFVSGSIPKKPEIEEVIKMVKEKKYVDYSDMSKTTDDTTEEDDDSDANIYVIPPDRYDEFEDYDAIELVYYADGQLCDENDEPIGDVESKVGKDFAEHFGDYEPDAVHIRNENLKVDYEICMDERSYHDIYHR